jgi:ubiquinone/menaquinone biosynthesis C-methylase UbiE
VRLTGVDLTPAMIKLARQRADTRGREVHLRVGDAQALDLPDAQFDSVVATLALSSISDERQALAEARRVLRPGGRLLLLEHVRSPYLPVRLLQRLLNPLFVHCFGDHLLREPLDHLAAVGFVVERVERSKGGVIERLVATSL